MKKTRCIIALVAAMFAVGAMLFVACQKEDERCVNQESKTSATFTIPLDRGEIDVLTKEIGIAHNYTVFALYNSPDVEGMNASDLCQYIHNFFIDNGEDMGLKMLPDCMSAIDDVGDKDELYACIGEMIENGNMEWDFPDAVDAELIMNSVEEYYDFVEDAFLNSDTYDEFETACLDRLKELCESTTTIEDYFYMSAGCNITLSSFCAWVAVFSGFDNSKGLLKDAVEFLRNGFKAIKKAVSEMLEPLRNIVHADLEGGFWGGSVGLFGSAAAAVVSSGGVAIGVFAGCWCVGATVSSIVYAENH
ncbi:MAG: hypothetical protein KBT27_04805 [Prevotellaceae bacterium]|nr:hypothetical protein [Candidatus Colimorpha pelethequi]MBQ0088633.1 hypothetical protein [Candidatus Faecinaster equi]